MDGLKNITTREAFESLSEKNLRDKVYFYKLNKYVRAIDYPFTFGKGYSDIYDFSATNFYIEIYVEMEEAK